MAKKRKTSMAKGKRVQKPTYEMVDLIYVRNLRGKKKENEMLQQLKVLTGKPSNAGNIMWAGFKVTALIANEKNLKDQIRKLAADNAMKDSKYGEIKNGIKKIIEAELEADKKASKKKKDFIALLKKGGDKIPKATSRNTESSYNDPDDNDDFEEDDDDNY